LSLSDHLIADYADRIDGYQRRIAELVLTLETIRRKVYAHNRGGDLKPTLRKDVLSMIDATLRTK
jgi:hypothetical protein